MTTSFEQALVKAETTSLTKSDLHTLLTANTTETQALFKYADEIRNKYLGDQVHLRGIIEFSNYCKQNCYYCGLRANNKKINRYRLTTDQIYQTAQKAVALGYKTLVLQSGEDTYFSPATIAKLIEKIKKLNVAVTLSCGEQDYATYKLWREAGADRYLLKHETADPILFSKIRPGKTLLERIQCQHWLKDLGYQVGSGCMVGLPGQTIETLVDDLILMKEVDVEMAGIGPFIPHPDTPLAKDKQGTLTLTLKMVAIARIIMPLAHLPATTALATINPQGRIMSLQAGANVIMPNVSPVEFRESYQIYPNKACLYENPENHLALIVNEVESIGRTISNNQGHSPKLRSETN